MDKINKWNEWSEHVVFELEKNNKLNKTQKSLTTFLTILVGVLIALISYIWVDEKSENKARYEAINKVLIELQSSDKNQDIKITEINEWRKYYEKAKGEHNTRGAGSSQSPNQLINNIQFVPEEIQVVKR